jgi:hypothetical protein
MYLKRNISERSRNYWCRKKAKILHIYVWVGGCTGAGVCLGESSFTHPECNAQAPYCHMWPLCLNYIFRRYLLNGMIFGREKLVLNLKCVF